jgi:hypothetical protein
MRSAKLAVRCSALVAVLMVVGFIGAPSASAHGLTPTAHTSAAHTLSSCAWYNDIETTWQYNAQNIVGQTVPVWWDVEILSYRNTATGAYCGLLSDHVCLTTSSNFGWSSLAIFNEWYTNWNYKGYRRDAWNIYQPSRFCSYSGAWSQSGGTNAEVSYYFSTGGFTSGDYLLEDCCVG